MSVKYPFVVGPAAISPYYGGTSTATIDASLFAMKADGNYFAFIAPLEKSGVITDVGFWIAISGTASQYLFDLVTIDSTTGLPLNINYGGSSGTVYEANQLSNEWNWIPLSAPATGTLGDIVSARVKSLDSTTTDYISVSSVTTHSTNLPRLRTSTATSGAHPVVAIKYNDGTVQGMPLSDLKTVTYNADSDPDERGMKFSVPMDMTCSGVVLVGAFGQSDSFRVILYNDTDVVRVAYVSDEDAIFVTAGYPFRLYWSNYDLVANGTYRLTVQSETASDDVSLYELSLVTGSYGYVFPGGIYWEETYRTDSGSFTDRPNDKLWMGILTTDASPSTGTSTTTTILAGVGAHAWAY